MPIFYLMVLIVSKSIKLVLKFRFWLYFCIWALTDQDQAVNIDNMLDFALKQYCIKLTIEMNQVFPANGMGGPFTRSRLKNLSVER